MMGLSHQLQASDILAGAACKGDVGTGLSSHFLYPFIWQWTRMLFFSLGYCEWCCNEHGVPLYLRESGFISLDKYPGVEWLAHTVALFLILWGRTSILFSIWVAPITFLPRGFPIVHILPNTCYLLSFWQQPSKHVWGDISLGFFFAFPWWFVIFNTFSYTCWTTLCS